MTSTLDTYVQLYLNERRDRAEITANTLRHHRIRLRSLTRSFGARPVTHLTEAAIGRWLFDIRRMKASSRRSYLSSVRLFCRWMVRRGHLTADPTADVARVKVPRSTPRAIPAAKVAALLRSRPDLRSQAIIWLMVGVGLRCCEVARLEVGDYDPVALTLFIVGKSSNERVVPVPLKLKHILNAYIDSTSWQTGPLIRSDRDPARGLTPARVSVIVGSWMVDCGVKQRRGDGISAHALRHTCASDVLDECGDLRVVQELLGHANLATSAIYLRRASQHRMREALEGRTYSEAA